MKALKTSVVVLAVAAIVFGLGGMAYAFHSGGVAECEGCHSMHNGQSTGGGLLVGSDASSTCLSCHEHAGATGPSQYYISTAPGDMPAGIAPLQRTPGGDFGWLKKDYTFAVRGATTNELGQSHGHNIIAVDKGYTVDTDNPTAPGGTFNSNNLACNSCHDQHSTWRRTDTNGTLVKPGLGIAVPPIAASGSYNNSVDPIAGSTAVGVFRLLAGTGWVADGITFAVQPPQAVVNTTYNRSEAANTVRDAYGKGMGQWCATCHPDMHTATTTKLVHPVSQNIGATIYANYNAYVKSGDLTGVQATSFNSLVPYEENSTNYTTLKAIANATAKAQPGPSANNAQVMCLSCHRAHASGWPEGLRWMYQAEFMTYNGLYPGIDNAAPVQFARGRTAAETQAAYYDRPITDFANYQRMLCNKCHAKD